MDGQDVISIRHYFETLLQHYCDAHQKEHALMAENTALAKEAMDNRMHMLNQFREQMQNERGVFITNDKFEIKHEALTTLVMGRIEYIEKRLVEMEKGMANLVGRFTAIG